MGMFSYCCKKCGSKPQFDWMPSCVVEIPKVGHVKGHYDGYGRVKVKVQGKKDPVLFRPRQFRGLGILVGEDANLPETGNIYCNGNDAGNDEDKLILMMLKQSQKEMQAMTGGSPEDVGLSEDETPRFCVPKDIAVMDELTSDQYEALVASPDGEKKVGVAEDKKPKSKTSSNRDTNLEGTVFTKGAYVILDGLKSEAGQKINGAKGIILNKSSVTDGVSRYPVLLYATKASNGELAVLNPTTNKKIKAENLLVDSEDPGVNQLLQDVSIRESMAAQEKIMACHTGMHNSDIKAAYKDSLFWAEQMHKSSPGDFGRTITYANALRSNNRFSEALAIFQQLGPLEDHIEPSNPNYPHLCFDCSMARSMAGEELDQALEYALKIPYPQYPDLAYESLTAIVHACDRLMQAAGFSPAVTPQISDVRRDARQRLVQMSQQDEMKLREEVATFQHFLHQDDP